MVRGVVTLPKWSNLSLRGQMIALVLAAVIPFEVITIAIDVVQIRANHRSEIRNRGTAFMREAIPAIAAVPASARPAVAKTFANSERSLRIASRPAAAAGLQRYRAIEARILDRLREDGLPVAAVEVADIQTVMMDDTAGVFADFRTMSGRPAVPASAGSPSEPVTVAILSARLEEGPSWYNFYILAAPIQWVQVLIARSIDTFLTLLITAIVIILTGRIMGPLRRLVVNAERFGRGEDIGRIEAEGSADVRETIEAFNRMAGRVTQTLDYQVALTQSLGHDLKGPLQRAIDQAVLAEPPDVRSRLIARLGHMESLVEAVSAFASATRRDGQSVRVDVPSLLEALVDEEADAGNDVSIRIDAQAIVRGRHNALSRAFTNLIDNAVKYGGSADVTVTRERATVVVFVDDDGPGIPPDQIEAAFRPFERLSSHRPGTGLGLSIVRTIIVDHGGTVALQNRPEGGLRAIVRLPPEPTDH